MESKDTNMLIDEKLEWVAGGSISNNTDWIDALDSKYRIEIMKQRGDVLSRLSNNFYNDYSKGYADAYDELIHDLWGVAYVNRSDFISGIQRDSDNFCRNIYKIVQSPYLITPTFIILENIIFGVAMEK